jgi:hypothetical protein
MYCDVECVNIMEERVLYLNEGVCLLLFRKFIFERDMIVHFK